jgi:hypothetical protein
VSEEIFFLFSNKHPNACCSIRRFVFYASDQVKLSKQRSRENKPYDYWYSFSSGLGIAHMKDFNLYNESGNKI